MLCQVRLLSVAFATVLADVRLQVLRLFVLRYMLEEAGLVGEALVAGVAFVRLVGLMAPRVTLEVAQLTERLRTTWMPTLVRLVTGVRAYVLL